MYARPPSRHPTGSSPPQLAPSDHHVVHDPTGPSRLTTTVVHGLADVMGRDVTAAEEALAAAVHPDGLDRLFARTSGSPPAHLAFTVAGYRVTVYSTGNIVITPPSPR